MKNLLTIGLFMILGLTFSCGGSSETAEETMEADSTAMEATEEMGESEPAEETRPSPARQATGTVGDATVNVNYSSPSVRGREIWGALVPYGQVWRTGANEATTFEVSQDIQVEGQPLPAGKYALFTVPNQDKWTVIFNTVPDQWGSNSYDQSKDALRVDVTPQMLDQPVEAFDIALEGNTLMLRWEKVAVPVQLAPAS